MTSKAEQLVEALQGFIKRDQLRVIAPANGFRMVYVDEQAAGQLESGFGISTTLVQSGTKPLFHYNQHGYLVKLLGSNGDSLAELLETPQHMATALSGAKLLEKTPAGEQFERSLKKRHAALKR
jgi:hypothetical protein